MCRRGRGEVSPMNLQQRSSLEQGAALGIAGHFPPKPQPLLTSKVGELQKWDDVMAENSANCHTDVNSDYQSFQYPSYEGTEAMPIEQ